MPIFFALHAYVEIPGAEAYYNWRIHGSSNTTTQSLRRSVINLQYSASRSEPSYCTPRILLHFFLKLIAIDQGPVSSSGDNNDPVRSTVNTIYKQL